MGQALSDGYASGVHADDDQAVRAAVTLQNFVGDSSKGASHLVVGKNSSSSWCEGFVFILG
jgi:hypothetical protein